ncbi:anti-anti-sigma factor [Blastococcus aggregatus]|uniref:Anti-anti-sigma factor n=1 Tax=Blastococcus aggregatus TaxID=38502 RepID=A0A285VAL3_9ACTN|nr:STAS domain-containing protein [Blastococcus aggregatus]SOC50086.1 anti-anti-sigma factor [Blastococcus aggregatus]
MASAPAAMRTSQNPEDEVVVRLDEAVLADGLADARWLMRDAVLAGARWIVVDLSRVHSVGSPALATFLSAHRVCRARGGAVVLRGADRRTRDMVRRTGLSRVLHLQGGPVGGGEKRDQRGGGTRDTGTTGANLRRPLWA